MAVPDPLPRLVEDRFLLFDGCMAGDRTRGDEFARRVDEVRRHTRRLDERIIRTVALSAGGLLAQLRLLSAFYEESANGAGRRGRLLIESIAAGVKRLDLAIGAGVRPPNRPDDPCRSAASIQNRVCVTRQEAARSGSDHCF
jgi:hypothetical protein